MPRCDNPAPTLRRWLAEGPFALGMSSGFFSFFAHCGVLTVLEDAGLLPGRCAGSSAGGLVAGAWAAGIDGSALQQELLGLRREQFWDPGPGLGLLRGERFRRRLEALLPARSFAECRVPLSVSAFDLWARATVVLDTGPLAPAIHASCAVPLMFQPVRVQGRLLLDGGVADRPGLAGIPAGTRLFYHHIASRSPWRRRGSAALRIPERPQMTTLSIHGLPRVDPFHLDRGARAFAEARRAMTRALDLPLRGPVLAVEAR